MQHAADTPRPQLAADAGAPLGSSSDKHLQQQQQQLQLELH
jgi:hypothetical protein